MTSVPIELQAGELIGERYRIVRRLGAGGIGLVYEAENTWTLRHVAIKVLLDDTARDPEQLSRFRQEAQIASSLKHPNIVDVLDMGPDGATGRLFIVQELLEGESLQALLERRGRLSPDEAFHLVLPVMEALAAAHAKGILHRDIKPSNIVLARDPHGKVTPKVIDFGLAKVIDGGQRNTRTGSLVGTPYYMSPEQARGESNLDARIDVWAVGVVLFELLSGRVPFDGDNSVAVMWSIASKPCPRLDEVAQDVPRAVADVVAAALVMDRAGRYPSMQHFLDASRAWESATSHDARWHHAPESAPPSMEGASHSAHLADTVPAGLSPAPDQSARDISPAAISRGAVSSLTRAHVSRASLVAGLLLAVAAVIVGTRVRRSPTSIPPERAARTLAPPEVRSTARTTPSSRPADATTVSAGPATPLRTPRTCPAGAALLEGRGFVMGLPEGEGRPNEHPATSVVVASFCLDRTEVPVRAYRECVRAHGCTDPLRSEGRTDHCNWGRPGAEEHPINCVDWFQSARYCAWRGGRLPTEVEWEFAARGEEGRRNPWGSSGADSTRVNLCGSECGRAGSSHGERMAFLSGWHDEFPTTAPVEALPLGATPEGVLQLAGNVWEWTSNVYATHLSAQMESATLDQDAGSATAGTRAIRGGCYRFHSALQGYSTRRHGVIATVQADDVGVRCAYDVR